MDLDQFLAELNQDAGERSQFAVDWARAQAKMGAHLGLEANDYACHFAQLAYLLGSSQLQLTTTGDWLEWSCDGRPLDQSKMEATAAGELLMAELDLCLNFCLQCLVLTDYAEKVFCSGGWQLIFQNKGWKLRKTNTEGTRLQLKIAWKSRVKNFLRSPRSLPELEALAPRLAASPLQLKTSQQPQRKDRCPHLLRVQGQAPLSLDPPAEAEHITRLEYPELEGSFWLQFQGHECQILSLGLGYTTIPFLPGRIWFSLGSPGTDLGHRELVLSADFQLARSKMLRQLSRYFQDWSQNEALQQAGVSDWLLNCLLAVGDLEPGPFNEALTTLPLISTQYHGRVSLLDIDYEVPIRGCRVIEQAIDEEFEEKPFLIVSDRPLLTSFLRQRYKTVHSGEEVLQQLRRRKVRQELWRESPVIDPTQMEGQPFSWPLQLPGWRGRIGFDPSLRLSRLDCCKGGRVLMEIANPPGLLAGFHVQADHPEIEPDDDWELPRPGPAWDALQAYLKERQSTWLMLAAQELPLNSRRALIWSALESDHIDPEPLLHLPLEANPALTAARWLSDGRRGDLREWVEAQSIGLESMRSFLVKRLGGEAASRAIDGSINYAAHLRIRKMQTPEPRQLPGEPLVQLQTPFPLLLGLGANQDLQFRFYRNGRLFEKQTLPQVTGLPRGLLVAAESDDFRLTLGDFKFDYAAEGYAHVLQAIQHSLPDLLTAALESSDPKLRPLALNALEQVQPRHWPEGAPLFARLNGAQVSLFEARHTETARALVGAAARVPLPGFEECWWVPPKERAWVERLLEVQLVDVTKAYNEAYRASRYETGETQQAEPLPDWSLAQSFSCGGLRAQAGLVPISAPAHACETTFCRGGRAAMRCQLVLSAGRGREAPESLVCRVDWEELPFVENYSQLRALPEVVALLEWLRLYAFDPALNCPAFQLARLEVELPPNWESSPDPLIGKLAATPILGTQSLRDLLSQEEILWGEEPAAPLRLPSANCLPGLQRLLPRAAWRHWQEPAPDQAMKEAVLRQRQRKPALQQTTFLCEGRAPGQVWGVAWRLTGPSEVRVLYQGRPAGRLQPNWDVEVEAEIDLRDIQLDPQGEIRPVGEAKERLIALWSEIQAALLAEKLRTNRLRLALAWLARGKVPAWASPLMEPDGLIAWWAEYTPPRPFVFPEASLKGVPQFPPALVGWAQQIGVELENCTDFARRLSAAPPVERPVYDFQTEMIGYYLSTCRESRTSITRDTSAGRVLGQREQSSFPPYYLERQHDRWKPPAAMPPSMFKRLWKWWEAQLDGDLKNLGWLADLDLEQASPGAEEVLRLARQRLVSWQELNQDDWSLLRQSLQLLSPEPLRLVLCEQGPLLKFSETTLRFNHTLAGPPGRQTTLQILNLASLDLPEARPIPWVLHQLT